MKVSRDKIESVIRKRYAGDSIVTERQIEGMIAKVQDVLDVTESMAGWSAAEIHGIASAACQAQIYEESGDRRMKR